MVPTTNIQQDLPVSSGHLALVYIFLESGSWMMSFPFYCSEISYEKIFAVSVPNSNLKTTSSFLKSSGIYNIQIDPIDSELVFPISKIKLESIEIKDSSMYIEGSFIETTKEMMDAINQIKLTSM